MKIDPPKKLEKEAEEVQPSSALGDLDSMYKKASLGDRVRGFSNKNEKNNELSDEERSKNQAMAAMAIPVGVGTVAKSRHQIFPIEIWGGGVGCGFFCLFVCFWSFCPFTATPVACGGSQATGRIGAVAAGLCQSHSNARSEPHLQPTPQLTTTPDP